MTPSSPEPTQCLPAGADKDTNQETARQPFAEPKLAFIQPTLTRHGSLAKVTAGFFGIFSP